jgi:hypothetical protein
MNNNSKANGLLQALHKFISKKDCEKVCQRLELEDKA